MSENDVIACIPDSLYMFLALIFGGQNALENDSSEDDEQPSDQTRILSLAQDLIYCVSGVRSGLQNISV